MGSRSHCIAEIVMTRLVRCCMACVGLLIVVPFGAGDDWLLFRGNPRQNGVVTAKLPDSLDILWKVRVKDGIEGTAAIVGDTVYFGAFDNHLHAVALADGTEKWKYHAGAGLKAAPSVHAGAVY